MESTLSVTEAVKKFVTNIKKKYKGRRLIHEEQLLCSKSEKLVRLELVERERLQASKQRGNSDDKVIRTPLAYADLFKVESGKKEIKKILIDGDAGIGKTSFCTALSEDWANSEILQEFELLLLLPLREQEVALAGSLLDLLKLLHPSDKICSLVKEYFEEDEGQILIIADGWDELSKEKCEEGSFLYRFLFGSQYCSISTLVTSRPSASAPLHLLKSIDRFAEIRGFDKKHVVEYIKSEFEQEKAGQLLDRLESNPVIESICSVPLNCVIVCHLWRKHEGDLPTTMTGLYTKIILNIINRNIQKVPSYKNIFNLTTFSELPETLQQSWWLICQFAFQTLKRDQLVFSDKELKDFFPQGLSLDKNVLCFGLLQTSVSCLEVCCGRSFHFLHLTFQEYLAALFLVKEEYSLPVDNNYSSLISRLTTLFPVKSPCPIILRFFFGIVYYFEAFRYNIGQKILTVLRSELCSCFNKNVILSHFLWAFEAQNDQFTHIIADYVNRYRYPLIPCTIHEVVSIVYVIDNTPDLECSDMVMEFTGCGLCDSHITALADVLANKGGKLQVKSLNINDNKLTDRGVTQLFHRASAAFRSLEMLFLGWNEIRGECINSVLATLANPFNKSHKVELYFSVNPLEVSSLMVFRDALCHHQLSNLILLNLESSLSNDAQANAELILALDNCRALSMLDLSRNNLHVPGGRAIGKILQQLSLLELKVSDAKLGDEGIAALTQSIDCTVHIGVLDLVNNGIRAAGVSCLADSVCEGKVVIEKFLRLDNNSLYLEGAMALVRLLSSEYFQAFDLTLSGCRLTTVRRGRTHAISRPQIFDGPITCAGIREWVCSHGIQANSIDRLRLSDNDFTGEGVHLLAGFMYLCPQLSALYCNDSEISSDDLKQLLLLLSQLNLNLKEWRLCSNNINDDGVSTLIEHLPMFPSLIHINVRDNNQISPEISKKLKEICEKRQENFHQQKESSSVSEESLSSLSSGHTHASLLSLSSVSSPASDRCVDEASEIDSSVFVDEDEASTENSDQCSTPDTVELITLEPHPILQEVQQVQTRIAEGEASYGQHKNFSDSEDYLTPPLLPAAKRMKLYEGESEYLTLEARAAEEMSSFNETVFDRQSKMTAGEEVDQQHPKMDSGRTSITESQLQIRFHQDIQPDKAMVVEEDLSEILDRQKEQSSNSEDYFSPPSSPVAYYENESEHWALQTRATEEMSSFEVTALSGECRTVANEEVDQLHPIVVKPGRTAIHESQIGEVLLALKEVTRPHQLGIYLGIEKYELEKIEIDHPRIGRQMIEVIAYWLRNSSNCSWEALANAVEKMGGHGNLVERLRKMDLETQ